jgi:hypothetical protein
MKTLGILSLLIICSCATQDPALLVTITGQFRVPADLDRLELDVFDGTNDVKTQSWCVTPTATCLSLPVQTSLNESVTVVESGASHPQVKLNVEAYLGNALVGAGTATVNFDGNSTEPVSILVTTTQ